MIIDLGVWKVTLTCDWRDRLSIWVQPADDAEVHVTSSDVIAEETGPGWGCQFTTAAIEEAYNDDSARP
jgi:hypothetical protein